MRNAIENQMHFKQVAENFLMREEGLCFGGGEM